MFICCRGAQCAAAGSVLPALRVSVPLKQGLGCAGLCEGCPHQRARLGAAQLQGLNLWLASAKGCAQALALGVI